MRASGSKLQNSLPQKPRSWRVFRQIWVSLSMYLSFVKKQGFYIVLIYSFVTIGNLLDAAMTTKAPRRLKHDELVDETYEIGFMLASKVVVQLLANPFVGPLTNRWGYISYRNYIYIWSGLYCMQDLRSRYLTPSSNYDLEIFSWLKKTLGIYCQRWKYYCLSLDIYLTKVCICIKTNAL